MNDIDIDKKALHDDLVEAFIRYQHRLECPIPSATETPETLRLRYFNDPMFNAKVKSLAAGVMCILDKHIPNWEHRP